MAHIRISHLSVKFRIRHGRNDLKALIAGFFMRNKRKTHTDFMAVNDLTLDIKAGDRLGIAGHNGAGKSTLLKALCRVYEPSAGTIEVDGRIAPLLEIGAGFHPEFTGRENIHLNGAILGHSKKQIEAFEEEVIEFSGLKEFIDTPVKYYSTGMYGRLAFSVATAVQPEILILDEVFAGGDAEFVNKAIQRMRQMIDRASIMVFVSHEMKLLSEFCNRVIWLDHGKVLQDGPAAEVLAAYQAKNPTVVSRSSL